MPGADSTSITNNFVGRERELAELVAACESGAGSDAHLFLLYGEPGIGKTRLADELASRVKAEGLQVLWGRCWEGDGAPAYWPWIQVIRSFLGALDPEQRRNLAVESEIASDIIQQVAQIIPDLRLAPVLHSPSTTGKLDPNEAQFRLFDAVTNFLKMGARSHPMLIVLDDLHDAEEASLALLRFMARELKGAPILVVATYREEEVRRSPGLGKLIGELSREALSIPVSGLNESEVAKFVEFRAGQKPDEALVAKLCAATNGNPLFVDGIVRILVAEGTFETAGALDRPFKIPSGIREAIRNRLDALSLESNAILAAAAAIGNEFDFNLCQSIADVSTDEARRLLDEASSAGVVTALSLGRYRFSHALIRGVVYEELDTNGRIRIHGKIANRLEEIYRENLDPHLAELAYHFRAAGASEKAIEYSSRAAKAAAKVFAFAVAATHWREALALSKGQNDARRAATLVTLGRITAAHIDPAEGVALLEEALGVYRQLKDEEKVASTHAFLGFAIGSGGDFAPGMNVARALDHFRQAQKWKGEWVDSRAFGWLCYASSCFLLFANRVDDAIAATKDARQAWERASNPNWVRAASFRAKLLVIKGRHREAALLFDEVADVGEEALDPESFRSTTDDAGWCRLVMRDPIEARRFLTTGMDKKGLSTLQREKNFLLLASVELVVGNLAGAKEIAGEHKVDPGRQSDIAFREGDWESAIEMNLTMVDWARRTGHRWDEAHSFFLLFKILSVTGDFSRATEFLRQALHAYEPSDLLLHMRIRPQAGSACD